MGAAVAVGPINAKDRRLSACRECHKVYVCARCRTQKPEDNRGNMQPPMVVLVTLWGSGRTPGRHARRMRAAEGVRWPDGQIAVQWMGASEYGGRVEVFPSLRALQDAHGTNFEVIAREW